MKRLAFIAAMVVTLLSTSAFSARSVHATSCTPSWHTVKTSPILITYVFVGSVSLLRDGCGDIQAKITSDGPNNVSLTITNVTTSITVYASGVVFARFGQLTSPIFSGYGGVGISVTGTVTGGSATTTPDYGA